MKNVVCLKILCYLQTFCKLYSDHILVIWVMAATWTDNVRNCIWLCLNGHGSRYEAFFYFYTCNAFFSSPNPMFDHLIESSHRDDSNKWSNIGFGEDIMQVESTEFNFTPLIGHGLLNTLNCKLSISFNILSKCAKIQCFRSRFRCSI